MPVLVALSRIYRGEHHPTDILGSLLFSALWLTATTLLIKPNANSRRARNQPGPMRRAALPGRQSAAQPPGPRAGLAPDLCRLGQIGALLGPTHALAALDDEDRRQQRPRYTSQYRHAGPLPTRPGLYRLASSVPVPADAHIARQVMMRARPATG